MLLSATRPRHDWGRRPTHGLQVPLLTAVPEGELHRGYFRVPVEVVGAQAHTNARHRLEQERRSKLRAWVEWKMRQGWFLNGPIDDLGTADPPTERAGMESDEGDYRYWYVQARFKRGLPLFMSLDDFLATKDQADRYGVALDREALPENRLPAPKEHIVDHTPPGVPYEQAAERWAGLGLKRVVELDKDGLAVGRLVEDNAGRKAPQTVTERT